jgi:tetratricopeptide (TPR) repeat protein
VSKKHKHHAEPERPLADRVAKARQEGRTQQALDLARQLSKQQNTEANLELLRQVTVERGQHLQAQGMLKDAATLYGNALLLGGSEEYRTRVGELLASSGAAAQALTMAGNITDSAQRQRIVAHAADAAVIQGAAGKTELPVELQASFDLVQQAFAHSEAGRDEEARAALQGIGLQSPFLEWKLFLRGVLAYYAKDDVRAIENWQRLDPKRLPARLAAPLRYRLDPAFRQAQPVAAQTALARQFDRLQGPMSVAGVLQGLRQDLPHDNLAPAFRKVDPAVATLRKEYPDLVARLAHVFAWAILDHGQPEDLDRYVRVFGRPADDPQLYRLEALALESRGMVADAHKAWQNFMAEVEKSPQVWPAEVGQRLRAMIWARMAENAGFGGGRRRPKGMAGVLDMFQAPPTDLKPDAEQCYRKAIELAPDRLESYEALFELYRQNDQAAKAKKIGQELLQRFPEHAATLEALGELMLDTQDYKKAQEYFDRSLQANPLDRSLRGKLARARQKWALELTTAAKFEPARQQFAQALNLWEGAKTSLLCQWTVAEMKAKDPARAEELLAQAQATPDQRLAVKYVLVSESTRAKLPPKEKKQLTQDLKAALAATPVPAEILALLESAAEQRQTHAKTFHGQKSHEKTILKFLEQLPLKDFTEPQLERLCAGLQGLQARKPWQNVLEHARRRFLKNASFRLSWVDYYLTGPRPEDKTHLAREHLDQARRLIEGMPRGEHQQQLQEQIQEKEKFITELGAGRMQMLDVMDRIFGGFSGDMDEDGEEYYYEDDDENYL